MSYPANTQTGRQTDKRQLNHILLSAGHRQTNSWIRFPLVVVNRVVVVVAGVVVMAAEVTVAVDGITQAKINVFFCGPRANFH